MDSGLKKRLIGAVVLIALAVIFVPMLLPGHSDSGAQSVSVKIPPQPGSEMKTRILEVGPDGASAGASTQATINDPDHVATLDLENKLAREHAPASPNGAEATVMTPAPAAAPAASVPKPLQEPDASAGNVAASPAGSAPPAASAQTGPVPGGAGAAARTIYTVNLGIYADHASANKLVATAKQHGFTALASPETFQGKPVMRVRVGPFHNRAEAEAARLRLKGFAHVSMKIDAGAVNQAGDAPASAIGTGQVGAWAVQLAAFSDRTSAEKLRDRLRGQGFAGYVDSVKTSKGKLWRVRAGPFVSRDTALARRGQIAQKLKIKGNIVTE